MSSTTLSNVHHGFWVDQTQDRWQGCILTLPGKRAGYLQSFTGMFTTIVFAVLWNIICVGIHYVRSTDQAEDGLKHQQQVIIRNNGAPVAAFNFLKQAYHWRGKAFHAKRRSVRLACFAIIFVAAAAGVGTFSAQIWTTTSRNRLIQSSHCGFSTYTDTAGQINSSAFTVSRAYDATTAASYARTCYDNATAGYDQCKRYIQPSLSWIGTENTTCPFQSGICSNGDQAAFTLQTLRIDSLEDLGINSHPSDRLILQKQMICSSIREIEHYHQDGNLTYYDFGPIPGVSILQGSTFVYSRLAKAALIPYTLTSTYSLAGMVSPWTPIPALNRTDADVTIVFVAANDVIYAKSNQDPVFAATQNYPTTPYYLPDYDVSTMACAEQYQFCVPGARSSEQKAASCSPWMGAIQALQQFDHLNSSLSNTKANKVEFSGPFWDDIQLQMTAQQIAILGRMVKVLPQTSLYNAISTRGASALRLQDSVTSLMQTEPISDNYWTSEVGWWFDACLARLQEGVMSFVTGPSDPAASNSTWLPMQKEYSNLCGRQLTRTAGDGTVNFSVLGICLLYGIGLILIGLSFSIEKIVKTCLTKFWPDKLFKTVIWEADELMHLQAAAFNTFPVGEPSSEGSGNDESHEKTWALDEFPTTIRDEKLVHYSVEAVSV